METQGLLFVNTTLIVGCTALAFVFLILPLPNNRALHKYRISLRFLAGGYISMAILKLLVLAFNVSLANFISMERLIISSLQATLFAISMITLINPRFVTKVYLYKQITPVFILGIVYFLVSYRWGDVQIRSFADFVRFAFYPAMIIRELLLFYYVFQLLYLSQLFFRQVKLFEKEMGNYFSECSNRCIPWVRCCYYAILAIGIGALLSCFILTNIWILMFTITYTLFYLAFGIYYIQYPRKFVYIEPVIYPSTYRDEEKAKSKKRLVWEELKKHIITEKYYLRAGITVEEMAQYLKIGRTTLSTFINNNENMSFNLWINSLRMEDAKYFLKEYPNYSIAQIAEMTGHSELSNFSRQFKLITNESPSVWRQACQS